ncbi:MAG: HU-CCDC81 and SPOR domain-containing protein [Bacteroidetes bacterium]|nr:HU-CCDC81 and SPOR domain-containing protein [Bacteroidota bacterium]MBT6685132.1 HU-CCDC81 and SPOR domain-containing protein [Bacteroidota bacterium]MBT7142043.1 HU-CCDC81 and SPOR domain-containing protein [Bacteroidota bacterium]MBT7493365.1 HU-CCDC81 and SPOR domain-containing protein [Bacteroidota bacterium]
MKIEKYIYELLFQHDCVILPDFGGFITNYKPAKIDNELHKSYPPAKKVSFNINLRQNDGLLIKHISDFENIDYKETNDIVAKFVKEINEKLQNADRINFEGIGQFQYDKEKNLQFEPEQYTNFLLDSYGLSTFHFPALKEKKQHIRIKPKFENKSQVSAIIRNSIFRRATIGVSIAAIMIFVPYKMGFFQNSNFSFANLNPFSGPKSELLEHKRIFLTEIESRKAIVIASDSFNEKEILLSERNIEQNSKVELVDTDINNSKLYHIIGGSFVKEKNAQKYFHQIIDEGFPAKVLPKEKGKYRVAIFSFEKKLEATNKLSVLRKDNSSLWLLRR